LCIGIGAWLCQARDYLHITYVLVVMSHVMVLQLCSSTLGVGEDGNDST